MTRQRTGRAFLRDAPVTDAGAGLVTRVRLPGGGELQLYQPSHATAYDK